MDAILRVATSVSTPLALGALVVGVKRRFRATREDEETIYSARIGNQLASRRIISNYGLSVIHWSKARLAPNKLDGDGSHLGGQRIGRSGQWIGPVVKLLTLVLLVQFLRNNPTYL